MLIYNSATFGGYDIAEKSGVPTFAAFPAPMYSPTKEFTSPFFPFSNLGPFNKFSHQLCAKLGPAMFRRPINDWRRDVLGLPPPGTAGSTVTLSAVFDGWGYVHLFNAATLQEIDTYAVAEGLDPNFASGFGNLTVHEVAVDIETDLAYLSYYDAGLRVIKFGNSGIQEVGHFIDEDGNAFWGVQVFRLPGDPTEQTYVAASDRDSGLWIFKYTGP